MALLPLVNTNINVYGNKRGKKTLSILFIIFFFNIKKITILILKLIKQNIYKFSRWFSPTLIIALKTNI